MLVIVSAAAINLIWSIRKRESAARRDRRHWLAGLMFPVGLEVGFSSAGAGALGSVALLSTTFMPPPKSSALIWPPRGALMATRVPPRALKLALSCSLLLAGLHPCANAGR